MITPLNVNSPDFLWDVWAQFEKLSLDSECNSKCTAGLYLQAGLYCSLLSPDICLIRNDTDLVTRLTLSLFFSACVVVCHVTTSSDHVFTIQASTPPELEPCTLKGCFPVWQKPVWFSAITDNFSSSAFRSWKPVWDWSAVFFSVFHFVSSRFLSFSCS